MHLVISGECGVWNAPLLPLSSSLPFLAVAAFPIMRDSQRQRVLGGGFPDLRASALCCGSTRRSTDRGVGGGTDPSNAFLRPCRGCWTRSLLTFSQRSSLAETVFLCCGRDMALASRRRLRTAICWTRRRATLVRTLISWQVQVK